MSKLAVPSQRERALLLWGSYQSFWAVANEAVPDNRSAVRRWGLHWEASRPSGAAGNTIWMQMLRTPEGRSWPAVPCMRPVKPEVNVFTWFHHGAWSLWPRCTAGKLPVKNRPGIKAGKGCQMCSCLCLLRRVSRVLPCCAVLWGEIPRDVTTGVRRPLRLAPAGGAADHVVPR